MSDGLRGWARRCHLAGHQDTLLVLSMSLTLLVEQYACLIVGYVKLAYPAEMLLVARVVRLEFLLATSTFLVVTPHNFTQVVFVLHF